MPLALLAEKTPIVAAIFGPMEKKRVDFLESLLTANRLRLPVAGIISYLGLPP